jgi:hypothetical protein
LQALQAVRIEKRERKGRGKGEERERKGRGKGEERERKGRGKGDNLSPSLKHIISGAGNRVTVHVCTACVRTHIGTRVCQ